MPVTYEDAERLVAARLGEKLAAHSRGVAQCARELAEVYGVDPDAAALAGILHDWDKHLSIGTLAARAGDLGVDLSPDEEHVPHVLHAKTGAADLRVAMPDLPDEIIQAVEYHTVGSAGMTDLDRVVYIADMIEPGREYPGVEELRCAVGEVALRELFVLAFAQTVRSLIDRRRPIHSSTVETWNSLIDDD
ncbi:MAG: bis(5'-nucleosyl)-tetraphosphatase (symmetrical) YqeK [Coriobacteriales bacterium]|nr:bis(5'-nucleosyl)-tetraphosphatase (symmetrical) YqeK [Coriobacteriales bacterium]